MQGAANPVLYTDSTLLSWRLAAREAQIGNAAEIEPVHLFLGLCKLCDMDSARVAELQAEDGVRRELEADVEMLRLSVDGLGLDPKPFRRQLRARLRGQAQGPRAEDDLHRSGSSRRLFARAESLAEECLDDRLRPVHLLTALLEVTDPTWAELATGLEPAAEVAKRGAVAPTTGPADAGDRPTPFLDRFGRDLTRIAREGGLEPVIGRREEQRELARALVRQRKRCAVLLGEAGVGKTGIVEGLALRITDDAPPPELASVRIVELQMAALIAGTKNRGEFEERMQNVIEEARGHDDVILFIDEIHTLLGAGGEGASDAANILKPPLARGELRVIGATTSGEYSRHLERDPALERRFEVIRVEEPSPAEAFEILAGIGDRLEAHHGIAVSDEAIEAAIELTVRHLPERRLPDKAIDVVDQALAAARLGTLSPSQAAPAPVTIGRSEVAAVIARRRGIPVERLSRDEAKRLLDMEAALASRVVSQPEAVSAVCEAVRTARGGLQDPHRPVAVLLFAGPTGTGKTELAKALAELLFDDERQLVRLDLSEYKEAHSVSRLIGPPPGYAGYGEQDGELTGPLRARPYSVVLLDEIEKAHPEVLDLCLQIFDEGYLTDTRGRRASFRDAVIILTSNLGAQAGGRQVGFGAPVAAEPGKERERVERAVSDRLTTELRSRIDRVVVFEALDEAALRLIVEKVVAGVRARMREQHDVTLELSEAALALLAREGLDERFGARELERAVGRLVVDPLARAVLAGEIPAGSSVSVEARDGELAFVPV